MLLEDIQTSRLAMVASNRLKCSKVRSPGVDRNIVMFTIHTELVQVEVEGVHDVRHRIAVPVQDDVDTVFRVLKNTTGPVAGVVVVHPKALAFNVEFVLITPTEQDV